MREIDLTDLERFIVSAKAATYAGDSGRVLPTRLDSHDYQHVEGRWAYHDSYVGSADFLGQEVVYLDGRARWSMGYYGYLVRPDLIDAATAGRVVMTALSGLYREGRFLGGWQAAVEGFDYVDTSHGDVVRFTGLEWIERDGERVYELRYAGGLIR